MAAITSLVAKGTYKGYSAEEGATIVVDIYAKSPGQRSQFAHTLNGDLGTTYDGTAADTNFPGWDLNPWGTTAMSFFWSSTTNGASAGVEKRNGNPGGSGTPSASVRSATFATKKSKYLKKPSAPRLTATRARSPARWPSRCRAPAARHWPY